MIVRESDNNKLIFQSPIRLFAFIAGGGGGRGKQFSTPVGDHVRVNWPELASRGIDK